MGIVLEHLWSRCSNQVNHIKGLFKHVKAGVVLRQESKIDDVRDALVRSIFY